MRFSILAASTLAATVACAPQLSKNGVSGDKIAKRDATTTAAAVPSGLPQCGAPDQGDTLSVDGVKKLLDYTGAMVWLNIELKILGGEKDWLNKAYMTVFPKDNSPLSGCGDIGGDCIIDTHCENYHSSSIYWVFKSVSALHSKINAVRSQLLWTGWIDGLSIDEIQKDFSTVPPNLEWAKWLSAAFTMAGGIATGVDLSKPLRGMIGFGSGAFNDVSLTKGASTGVDKGAVEQTLKDIVGQTGNYLADVLKNATGNGDASKLPILTESDLDFGTTRFFSDPTILLDQDKDNSSFVAAYKGFAQNVEKKMVDTAMKSAFYVLFGEEDSKEESCKETGQVWMAGRDGKNRCFYLTRPESKSNCHDNDPKTCTLDSWQTPYDSYNRFDAGVYKKLTDRYGFDLKGYYESLIDCELHGSNGNVDITASTNSGKVARCFYNGYVRGGYWLSNLDGSQRATLYFKNL